MKIFIVGPLTPERECFGPLLLKVLGSQGSKLRGECSPLPDCPDSALPGELLKVSRSSSLPIHLLETGERLLSVSKEDTDELYRAGQYAILVACADTAEGAWQRLATLRKAVISLGLPIIGEFYSSSDVNRERILSLQDPDDFAGELSPLVDSREHPVLEAFARKLEQRFASTNYQLLPVIQSMIADWQRRLGETVLVAYGGSLLSDTMVLDGATKIDIDIRFCVDNPEAPELIPLIESATDLRFRKEIEVDDWPSGTSRAFMIEGMLSVAGFPLPLDIEGCLRNRRRLNWHELYLKVFTPRDLEHYRRMKRRFRKNPEEYKRFKRAFRTEAYERGKALGFFNETE